MNNLINLGYNNIILYRKKARPLRVNDALFPVYNNLEDALACGPKVSFITNPTHLHAATALKCVRAGSHVFIEKPVSHSNRGVKELIEALKDNRKKSCVGYMLRFHPCFRQIKKWIDEKRIGRPLLTRTEWGEYLPSWHPWEDYRESYAGSRKMGGGPALTLSHDLDLHIWLFGTPADVKAIANCRTGLDIDTEGSIDILARFGRDLTANIHLDYLQSPPVRIWEIIGEKGRIFFDYYKGKVVLYSDGRLEKKFSQDSDFDRNELFIEEVRYFFDCIANGKKPSPGIEEAVLSMKFAREALRSAGI